MGVFRLRHTSPRLVTAALLSAILGGRAFALNRAPAESGAPAPAFVPDAPVPAVAPVVPVLAPRRWYGWQTLTVDAVAVGTLTLSFVNRGQGGIPNVGLLPTAVFCVGGPSVHAYHHRWGVAAVSLATRIVIPILAAFATGVQNAEWSNRRAAWGIVGGMAAVSLVDAAFAWDTPASR